VLTFEGKSCSHSTAFTSYQALFKKALTAAIISAYRSWRMLWSAPGTNHVFVLSVVMFSLLSDYLCAFSFLVVSQGGLPALSMYCIPDTGDQM